MNDEPEIVLAGPDVEMRNHYRTHVHDSLHHLGRYDARVSRYEVEFDHEVDGRSPTSHRVAITGRGTGPTVHAEAWGADFRAALDSAVGKLEEQLRRRRDRRRLRHDRSRRPAVHPTGAPDPQPSTDPSPMA